MSFMSLLLMSSKAMMSSSNAMFQVLSVTLCWSLVGRIMITKSIKQSLPLIWVNKVNKYRIMEIKGVQIWPTYDTDTDTDTDIDTVSYSF